MIFVYVFITRSELTFLESAYFIALLTSNVYPTLTMAHPIAKPTSMRKKCRQSGSQAVRQSGSQAVRHDSNSCFFNVSLRINMWANAKDFLI